MQSDSDNNIDTSSDFYEKFFLVFSLFGHHRLLCAILYAYEIIHDTHSKNVILKNFVCLFVWSV